MLDPNQLYTVTADPGVDSPVLVVALTGFVDAGNAVRLGRDHLLGPDDGRVVATFDVDQLLDYRSRRPVMLFVEDHWAEYDEPRLLLHLLPDADGVPFLLLTGPEPDVQWERFCAAVKVLVERFGVRLTVGVNAIPMAVPHTRPAGVTVHGSRPELVAGHRPWVQRVQVPGSATHLLEYRLGQQGHDAMGVAVHVPHYLAQTEYPAATELLLSALGDAAGLRLSSETLAADAARVRSEVDAQIADSTDAAAMVTALERQYDAFVRGREGSLLAEESELPTADELGAELERFLADQPGSGPDAS